MRVTVRSYAKINLGLRIGGLRADGYHELHTVYQTIALHDRLRVQVTSGSGIEVRCADPRVPTNESNTCYRLLERAMAALKARGRVVVEIEKKLPVQGGLGGASSNAIAAVLALQRALQKQVPGPEMLRLAAEVGSDLPLFLIGGTVLGAGRGEEVYPLADLPPTPCVIATPEIGISTPKAFADWDALGATSGEESGTSSATAAGEQTAASSPRDGLPRAEDKLTLFAPSDKMLKFGRSVAVWLSAFSQRKIRSGRALSGVPASKGRGRAETPLLDLVRTGIENDFEQVVFPQYPELREVKRVLRRAGAGYASLSGSGSAVFGLFSARAAAQKAAMALRKAGVEAAATTTLTRSQYWRRIFDC